MEGLKLSALSIGEKCKVLKIAPESKIRRRLMDMGIIPGVEITLSGKAPMGDPINIVLRGYNLTLRKSEAEDILIKK